jgi:hypothetical protein
MAQKRMTHGVEVHMPSPKTGHRAADFHWYAWMLRALLGSKETATALVGMQ